MKSLGIAQPIPSGRIWLKKEEILGFQSEHFKSNGLKWSRNRIFSLTCLICF